MSTLRRVLSTAAAMLMLIAPAKAEPLARLNVPDVQTVYNYVIERHNPLGPNLRWNDLLLYGITLSKCSDITIRAFLGEPYFRFIGLCAVKLSAGGVHKTKINVLVDTYWGQITLNTEHLEIPVIDNELVATLALTIAEIIESNEIQKR